MSVLNMLDFEDVVPKEVKYLNNYFILKTCWNNILAIGCNKMFLLFVNFIGFFFFTLLKIVAIRKLFLWLTLYLCLTAPT